MEEDRRLTSTNIQRMGTFEESEASHDWPE